MVTVEGLGMTEGVFAFGAPYEYAYVLEIRSYIWYIKIELYSFKIVLLFHCIAAVPFSKSNENITNFSWNFKTSTYM